jgi:tRNA modification GTPase
MIEINDTICAFATAPGQAGVAVMRISGLHALTVVTKLLRNAKGNSIDFIPRRVYFAHLYDGDILLDQVVAVYYKSPASYTGEDVVEVATHGSEYVQQRVLELLISNGARLAEAGEFTRRAFMNGKMDLSQSEAVADLIAAESKLGHQLAVSQLKGGVSNEIALLRDQLLDFVGLIELELDFGEEDVEFADRTSLLNLLQKVLQRLVSLTDTFMYGNAVKQGIPVAIVGPPNTGKSSLLNYLLHDEKAIVSEVPGTTRDIVEDKIIIAGYSFRFIDTAGIRETSDRVESMGIARTHDRIEKAAIVLLVLDVNAEPDYNAKVFEDISKMLSDKQNMQVLLNKSDLFLDTPIQLSNTQISVSAKTGEGIDVLHERLLQQVKTMYGYSQEIVLTNARHYQAFSHAIEALTRAEQGLQTKLSSDFVAQDIREALHYLAEVTGNISSEEILGAIFSRFCIGK